MVAAVVIFGDKSQALEFDQPTVEHFARNQRERGELADGRTGKLLDRLAHSPGLQAAAAFRALRPRLALPILSNRDFSGVLGFPHRFKAAIFS